MLIFITGLLASILLFKLGSYTTIISLMVTVSKVFVGITVIGLLFLLYKRYASSVKSVGHWRRG